MKKVLFATCCIAILSGSLGASAQKKSAVLAQKKSAAKSSSAPSLTGKSWSADNGNGTFTTVQRSLFGRICFTTAVCFYR